MGSDGVNIAPRSEWPKQSDVEQDMRRFEVGRQIRLYSMCQWYKDAEYRMNVKKTYREKAYREITPKSHLSIIPLLQPAKRFACSVEPNHGKPRRIEPKLADDCRGQKQLMYFLFWFSVPRLTRLDSWGSNMDLLSRARSFCRHAGHPIWFLISGNLARGRV